MDFYFFSFKKNIVTTNNYNNLISIPKIASLLHQDKNIFRIAAIANKDFSPNKNLFYGLESISIYTPLMLKNFWDIASQIYFKNNNYLFKSNYTVRCFPFFITFTVGSESTVSTTTSCKP